MKKECFGNAFVYNMFYELRVQTFKKTRRYVFLISREMPFPTATTFREAFPYFLFSIPLPLQGNFRMFPSTHTHTYFPFLLIIIIIHMGIYLINLAPLPDDNLTGQYQVHT